MRKIEGIAEKQIREVGLRHTAARAAALEELISADTLLSHAELSDRLNESGIDQATVFRNLNALADSGLLCIIVLVTKSGDLNTAILLIPNGKLTLTSYLHNAGL